MGPLPFVAAVRQWVRWRARDRGYVLPSRSADAPITPARGTTRIAYADSLQSEHACADSKGVRISHFVLVIATLTLVVYAVNRDRPMPRPLGFKAATSTPQAELPATGAAHKTDWSILRQFDHRTGSSTPQVRALHGQRVAVPGYVIPLEDDANRIGEFLLVPYFGACIHTPPPPPNQMVLVKMQSGREIETPFDPVWVHGVLHITEQQSPFGKTSFEMIGDRAETYRE